SLLATQYLYSFPSRRSSDLIDVKECLVGIGHMELGVAHGQAHDAGVADVGAVLAVVDLRVATLVVPDGVAAATAGVGEKGIRLGVGAGLGRRGGQDGDLAKAQNLDERRHGVIGHRDHNLFVVIAGRRDGRNGIAALGVSDRVIDRRGVIGGVRIVVGGVLVEDRKRVVQR